MIQSEIVHSNHLKAVNTIKENDTILATIINQIGTCSFERGEQGFRALVRSIIGQQLSKSAANTIFRRLESLFNENMIISGGLLKLNEEELRHAGLSLMKVKCLRELASYVESGKLDFSRMEQMDDDEIIPYLCRIKGIGRWTAEMYLMFSLGRLDIFPISDMALRNSISLVYGLPKQNLTDRAILIADQWRPFRTIGCWYLYRYLDSLK